MNHSRSFLVTLFVLVLGAPFIHSAETAEAPPPPQVLFENVRVFDGTTDRLSSPTSVLVENNLIKSIGAGAAGPQAVRIDGGGRTLMPGLIDSHVHINMYKDGTLPEFQDTTWEEIGARAAAFHRLPVMATGASRARERVRATWSGWKLRGLPMVATRFSQRVAVTSRWAPTISKRWSVAA